jgi:hypothetical protein
MASLQFVRYRADEQELEHMGATYVLRKTSDGWKISVLMGHDPSTAPRLD